MPRLWVRSSPEAVVFRETIVHWCNPSTSSQSGDHQGSWWNFNTTNKIGREIHWWPWNRCPLLEKKTMIHWCPSGKEICYCLMVWPAHDSRATTKWLSLNWGWAINVGQPCSCSTKERAGMCRFETSFLNRQSWKRESVKNIAIECAQYYRGMGKCNMQCKILCWVNFQQ